MLRPSPLPQVDIDIKLRSCKGSCERHSAYQLEVGGYVAVEKQVGWLAAPPVFSVLLLQRRAIFSVLLQLKQLDPPAPQGAKGVETLYVLKSRPLKDHPVDSVFKSKTPGGQQREDVFHEVRSPSELHLHPVKQLLAETHSLCAFALRRALSREARKEAAPPLASCWLGSGAGARVRV